MRDQSSATVAATIALILLAGAPAAAATTTDEEYGAAMSREHADDEAVANPMTAGGDGGETEGSAVVYATLDGAPVRGYLARPAGAAPGAGIILIHEWWGLNDHIRAMARKLAARGYAALAVDLYGGEIGADRDAARALMDRALEDRPRIEANLRAAHAHLTGEVGVERVGTIGWCFGGGWSLETALLLPNEIDATVIYYGRLVTDRDRLATLEMPILGIFGALDEGIPLDDARAFEATLEALGKNASIRVYEGADHAFANPTGTRYQADAAEDAWARTLEFFAAHL